MLWVPVQLDRANISALECVVLCCFVYVVYHQTLFAIAICCSPPPPSPLPPHSRNLGVHISKVRSITLDEWEPEIQIVREHAVIQLHVHVHVHAQMSG